MSFGAAVFAAALSHKREGAVFLKGHGCSKQTIKKIMLIACIALAVMTVLATVLWAVGLLLDGGTKKPDSLPDDVFYEADYQKNIFEDEAYMNLDRSVMYMEFDSGMTLNEENYDTAGVASEFFYTYFDAIIKGDSERYLGMLTENYIDDFDPPERFTMQMLYDIEVNRIQTSWNEEYQGKTVSVYNFAVKYKIFQNNGTFRNDIGSNQSSTQYYQLYSYDGEFYLNTYTNKQVITD